MHPTKILIVLRRQRSLHHFAPRELAARHAAAFEHPAGEPRHAVTGEARKADDPNRRKIAIGQAEFLRPAPDERRGKRREAAEQHGPSPDVRHEHAGDEQRRHRAEEQVEHPRHEVDDVPPRLRVDVGDAARDARAEQSDADRRDPCEQQLPGGVGLRLRLDADRIGAALGFLLEQVAGDHRRDAVHAGDERLHRVAEKRREDETAEADRQLVGVEVRHDLVGLRHLSGIDRHLQTVAEIRRILEIEVEQRQPGDRQQNGNDQRRRDVDDETFNGGRSPKSS